MINDRLDHVSVVMGGYGDDGGLWKPAFTIQLTFDNHAREIVLLKGGTLKEVVQSIAAAFQVPKSEVERDKQGEREEQEEECNCID